MAKPEFTGSSYLENRAEDVDEGHGDEVEDEEAMLPVVRVHQGQRYNHNEHDNLPELKSIKSFIIVCSNKSYAKSRNLPNKQ